LKNILQYKVLAQVFIFLLPFLFLSCKKDVDREIKGTYKGTAHLKIFRYPDVINPVTDTLFTDLMIHVSQSESSKRNNVKLNLSFTPDQLQMVPLQNVPVSNGIINYYTSERGVTTSIQWRGTITPDSLNLIYRREDNIKFVREYHFKTDKR